MYGSVYKNYGMRQLIIFQKKYPLKSLSYSFWRKVFLGVVKFRKHKERLPVDGYYHVRAFDYMSDGRILLLGQQTYIDVLVENASHHASAIYPGKRALQKKARKVAGWVAR